MYSVGVGKMLSVVVGMMFVSFVVLGGFCGVWWY